MSQDNLDSKENKTENGNSTAKPSSEQKDAIESTKGDNSDKSWNRGEWLQLFIALFTGGYLLITFFMWCSMLASNNETRRNNAESSKATEESLQLTRDSLKIANENLEQTKKSFDLSKKAFETTQRAWLVFSQATPPILSSRDNPINVIITNKGHIPAVNVQGAVSTWLYKAPPPNMSIDEIIGFYSTPMSQGILGPGDNFTILLTMKKLDEGDFKRIQIGSLKLYILGAYKYSDDFNRPRSLKLCLIYDPERGGWPLCPNNNTVE